MKLLAFDPGATRCGWACIDDGHLMGHGVLGLPRGDSEYQQYRLRVVYYYADEADLLIERFSPHAVVSEIVPVVGGGNFVAATQSQLASTAMTAIMTTAVIRGLPIHQIGATTIKKLVAGSGKASKIQVRNAVFEHYPDLKPEKLKDWTLDESDAIATGLAYLAQPARTHHG